MPRNLDAEWAASHPFIPPEQRTITWFGRDLIRKDDIPLSAFGRIESAGPNDRRQMGPIIEAIRECFEPATHHLYDEIIEQEDVGVQRLMGLWQFLVEESGSRPTQPASASSDGRSGNGTHSTDGRSTPEEWTSGASVPGASPTSPIPISPPT